jgi:pSer/pThr/pTyr-binding forkhead associated (FHA) protein
VAVKHFIKKQYKMIALDLSSGNSDYYLGMDEELDSIPPKAFFVIGGVKFYPLVKTIINIGRRLENDLVIDDPRVSRSHAQLRAIEGNYVLFDLSSTGGTFVNGSRVSQTIIYPNDTISLGGVALIFHQDDPPPRTDLIDTVR